MTEISCNDCEQSIYTKGIRKDFESFKSDDFRDLKGRVNSLEDNVHILNEKSAVRDEQYEENKNRLKSISVQNWAIILMILTSLLGYFFSKH